MNEEESVVVGGVVVVVVVIGLEQSINEVILKDKCIDVCMVCCNMLAHCPWVLTDRALYILLKQRCLMIAAPLLSETARLTV